MWLTRFLAFGYRAVSWNEGGNGRRRAATERVGDLECTGRPSPSAPSSTSSFASAGSFPRGRGHASRLGDPRRMAWAQTRCLGPRSADRSCQPGAGSVVPGWMEVGGPPEGREKILSSFVLSSPIVSNKTSPSRFAPPQKLDFSCSLACHRPTGWGLWSRARGHRHAGQSPAEQGWACLSGTNRDRRVRHSENCRAAVRRLLSHTKKGFFFFISRSVIRICSKINLATP